MTVISSQASVWLRYTWPRRSAPGRRSAGSSRSRRVRSSASGVVARLSVSACSIGRSPPSAPGPSTERNHAPPLSGGSSCTTRRVLRAGPTTGRAQRSRRFDTSAPAATGASKPEPSRRVMKASATAAGVCELGGGAGSSSFPAASRTMASTTAPRTSRVVARASPGAVCTTAPGIAAVSSSSSLGSTRAGAQRTARSRLLPVGRLVPRRVGTTEPRATRRTASTATRPNHVTLAPTPARPRPPPTATSQPSDSSTGIDSAAARWPSGSTRSGWRLQPSFGPPMASRRSASWPLSAGGASGPAAQTTTTPASQLACRRTSPAGSAAAMAARGSATRVSRS